MSSKNTSTLPPAVDGQSPLSLDDNDFTSYLGLIRAKTSKKRQHDDDEETRSPKRRNKGNIPLRNSTPADIPEPAVQKQQVIGSNADKKKSPDPGIGKKRPNEIDDKERRVKPRITEETSGGPPELAPPQQEYDEEYTKTFGHKMTLPEASVERGTPDDVDREMFRKSKEEAEMIGYIFLSFSFTY